MPDVIREVNGTGYISSSNPKQVSLATALSSSLDSVDVGKISKGSSTVAHSGITATATSAAIDMRGYNAIDIQFEITAGTGSWNIEITGCETSTGTFKSIYLGGTGEQCIRTGITANIAFNFAVTANYIKIVATEVTDGATVTVTATPCNCPSLNTVKRFRLSRTMKATSVINHNGITASVAAGSCTEIDLTSYTALHVQFLLTAGSGSWTVALYGAYNSGGTFAPQYTYEKVPLSVTGLTASSGWLWDFVGVNYVKIVPTEDSDGATVSIIATPIP